MNTIYIVIETAHRAGPFHDQNGGSILVAYAPVPEHLLDRGNIIRQAGYSRHELDTSGAAVNPGRGQRYRDDQAAEAAARALAQETGKDPNTFLLLHPDSQWLGRTSRTFEPQREIETRPQHSPFPTF